MATESVPGFVEEFNQRRAGFAAEMGLTLVSASADGVVAEWEIGQKHLQAYGVVHGGVYCSAIESVCSIGAALAAGATGGRTLGLDNHTSFLRAVREGRLTATARPLTRGRRTQLWECDIHDAARRLVATGRVRLICLEASAEVAGAPLEIIPGVS